MKTQNSSYDQETYSTGDLAKRWGCNRDKVISFIMSGELLAMNLSRGERPRYRIRRDDLEIFERSRLTGARPTNAQRRKRRSATAVTEYY